MHLSWLRHAFVWIVLMSSVMFSPRAFAEFVEQKISSGSGVNTLHGTLLLPTHKFKPPVILIVPDTGTVDRDGNNTSFSGKNDSLKMLAEELAIAGFASVRYDKRGVGESAIAALPEETLRFQNYVSDVEGWLKQLSADERFSKVAMIGHGEGSLVGMLAAQSNKVASFVSIAGAAQSASKLLSMQLLGRMSKDLYKISEDILMKLEKREFVKDVPVPLLAMYRPTVQAYLMSWFAMVPTEQIVKLTMPVMIIQGDNDLQLPISEAIALARAQASAQLMLVKGMNHIMKQVPVDNEKQVASYSDPDHVLDPTMLQALIGFLKKQLLTKLQPKS